MLARHDGTGIRRRRRRLGSRATCRSSSGFGGRHHSCWTRSKPRSPNPARPLVGPERSSVVDPKSPTELTASNVNYYLGPARDRSDRGARRFRACVPHGPNCCADRLTCCTRSGIDALDSLETSTNVSVFTHTRRYQYIVGSEHQSDVVPIARMSGGPESRRRPATGRRDALNGHGIVVLGAGLAAELRPSRRISRVSSFDSQAAAATFSDEARRRSWRRPICSFTCLVPPDAVNERIALVLKQQLAAVGVDMSIEEVSMDRIMRRAEEPPVRRRAD